MKRAIHKVGPAELIVSRTKVIMRAPYNYRFAVVAELNPLFTWDKRLKVWYADKRYMRCLIRTFYACAMCDPKKLDEVIEVPL